MNLHIYSTVIELFVVHFRNVCEKTTAHCIFIIFQQYRIAANVIGLQNHQKNRSSI